MKGIASVNGEQRCGGVGGGRRGWLTIVSFIPVEFRPGTFLCHDFKSVTRSLLHVTVGSLFNYLHPPRYAALCDRIHCFDSTASCTGLRCVLGGRLICIVRKLSNGDGNLVRKGIFGMIVRNSIIEARMRQLN